MKRLIMALFVAVAVFTAGFAQETEPKKTVCNATKGDIKIVVCFSEDFEKTANDIGFEWDFDYDQSKYEAVTFTNKGANSAVTLLIFRHELGLEVVSHELAHVKEQYMAMGEAGARFMGLVSNFVFVTADAYDIPLFYYNKETKIPLKRKQ